MCCGSLWSSVGSDLVWMGTICFGFRRVSESEPDFVQMIVLWLFSCFQQTWNDEIKKLLVISGIAWGFLVAHEGMDGHGQEQEAVFGCGEVASRGTVHQLLWQLQLLCFYFCAVFRLSTLLWKEKTSGGLSMYISIKHLLRRSEKEQWSRSSGTFWICWHCFGSEIVHLTLVEMLSLPQRLNSMLCPGAAGINETKFNQQSSSYLFIWVTGSSDETWKSPFAA